MDEHEQNNVDRICESGFEELSHSTLQLETIPENAPFISSQQPEEEEQQDTASYNSNTPLIDVTSEVKAEKLATYNEENIGHVSDGNIEQGVLAKDTIDSWSLAKFGFSAATIHETGDDLIGAPLRIIGSGWEFGSICSIHLQSDGIRSRTNTIDKHTYFGSQNTLFHDNRLLNRVFAKSLVGSKLSIKTCDKGDLNHSFLEAQSDFEKPIARTRNLKHLIILSLAMLSLQTSIFGLRNLQSSLNSKNGLGVFSLAAFFGSFMIGSLVSPFIVQGFLPKRCIVVGCLGHLLYIISNYIPEFYTIMPSSIVCGFGNAVLWNAVCTYVTEISSNEAICKNNKAENILSRFFGILFVSIQFSMVLGNLVSSLILLQTNKDPAARDSFTKPVLSVLGDDGATDSKHIMNKTDLTDIFIDQIHPAPLKTCGSAFCDDQQSKQQNVEELTKLFLLGTYSSCAILATLIAQFCLDPLSGYAARFASFHEVLQQAGSVIKISVDSKFIFIVPLCLYTVTGNGFVIADVLKAHVTCPLGIFMVGYTMICFGICGSASSYLFGKITPFIGRIATFVIAAVINLTSLAFMITWEATADDIYYIFLLLGAWGFSDGIWQSQINSLISTVFADRYEAAFGCCRVLQGLGGILVFLMSSMFCMKVKMAFAAFTCLLALVGYIVMEMLQKPGTNIAVIRVEPDNKHAFTQDRQ